VLACTHYPLLADRFARIAPWPVNFIDPAPAIARRVVDLIGPARNGHASVAPEVVFSSGRTPPPALWSWLNDTARAAPSPAAGLHPPR